VRGAADPALRAVRPQLDGLAHEFARPVQQVGEQLVRGAENNGCPEAAALDGGALRRELRRHDRPGRVLVGEREVNAREARASARLDERAEARAALAEDQAEVRHVAAQPPAVPRGGDRVASDEHRRVDLVGLRGHRVDEPHAERREHGGEPSGGGPAAVDRDAQLGRRAYGRAPHGFVR